jgi:hypothetical protein
MSKILISLILFFNFAYSIDWFFEKKLNLVKDEAYIIKLYKKGVRKVFFFRWTLMKDGGLVCNVKYDKFNHHFILYKRNFHDKFKLKLYSKHPKEGQAPYMWIELDKYFFVEDVINKKSKDSADINFFVYSELQDFEIQNVESLDQILIDDMLYLNHLRKNKDKK